MLLLLLLLLRRPTTNLLPEPLDLGQDHLLHLGDLFHDLEVEVERLGTGRLVRGVVPDVQVSVLESLLDRDPGRRVEGQHPVQQVQRVRVGVAEQRRERHLLHVRQVSDVLLGSRGADPGESLLVGRAEVVQDLVELVDVIAAFEERLASQEFGEDAADGPDVD